MQLIDSHCHLDFDVYADNLPEVIRNAKANHVEKFVVPAVSPQNWNAVLALSEQHKSIFPALGIHPYFLSNCDAMSVSDYIDNLEYLITTNPNVIAIGECGLDKKVADYDKQILFFEAQLKLAVRLKLPVIIHHRQSHQDILSRIKRFNVDAGGVIHAFSGSIQDAENYIKLGFKLGVGGTITYPRATKTRNTIAHIKSEYLMLETDSPDMPLAGKQGVANEPENVLSVLDVLTELKAGAAKGEAFNSLKRDLADQLTRNTESLFGI